MTRLFFKVHPFFILLFGLVFLFFVGLFISCDLSKNGAITSLDSSDSDSSDDDSDDSSRSDRVCDDSESCQRRCNYMFRKGADLSQCYELKLSSVDSYEEVFYVLADRTIDRRKLNNIDDNDFEKFLKLSVDSWVDIIDGSRSGTSKNSVRDAYSRAEARQVLLWIAENEDIARAIDDEDEDREILYELFVHHGSDVRGSLHLRFFPETASDTNIIWDSNSLLITKGRSSSDRITVNMSGLGVEKTLAFLVSYMGLNKSGLASSGNSSDFSFNSDSFVEYADNEDNDAAVRLAHKTAVNFCMEAVSEDDENAVKVKQCLLSIYCSIQLDNAFDFSSSPSTTGSGREVPDDFDSFLKSSPFDLDDRGRDMCKYENLKNSDRVDNYF